MAVQLEGSNVAAVTARRIGYRGIIVWPAVAALVGVYFKVLALVNGRAAGEQRSRGGRTAVHLQRADEGINRCGDAASLVGFDAADQAGAAVGSGNKVETLRNKIAGEVKASASSAGRAGYLRGWGIFWHKWVNCICPTCSTSTRYIQYTISSNIPAAAARIVGDDAIAHQQDSCIQNCPAGFAIGKNLGSGSGRAAGDGQVFQRQCGVWKYLKDAVAQAGRVNHRVGIQAGDDQIAPRDVQIARARGIFVGARDGQVVNARPGTLGDIPLSLRRLHAKDDGVVSAVTIGVHDDPAQAGNSPIVIGRGDEVIAPGHRQSA